MRIFTPKKGALGDARAAYLSAAAEADDFAQRQQSGSLRNGLDASEPSAALQRARRALVTLLAAARDEEWGVAVSIEL